MNSFPSHTLRDLRAHYLWATVVLIAATFVGLYGFFGYLTAYGPHLSVVQSLFWLYRLEEWSHCVLVPFIVGGILWWKRHELARIPLQPSLVGIFPLLGGLGFFWISYRLDDIYFAFISIQALLLGIILFFGGWAWIRALLFPWLFLNFAWPLFFLDNAIAFPLRMIMSSLSTTALNAIGLSAIQIGTSIQSAPSPLSGIAAGQRFQVDVADPCSGMRSLFALTMVTALYGYFTMKSAGKNLVLFICAVPLAILGNLARILMLTFGILVLGPKTAIGTLEHPSFYHMLSGFFVFIVALAGMVFIAGLLNGDYRAWINHAKVSARSKYGHPSARSSHPDSTPRSIDPY